MSTRQAWIFFVAALALFVAGLALTGCAAHPVVPLHPAPEFVKPGQTPASLTAVAKGLDGFILLSVIAVGVGIALFFLLPATHNVSVSLVAIGGGIEISSLVTRASLWLVPYAVIGLVVSAFVALVYELYTHKGFLKMEATAVKSDFETEVDRALAAVKSGVATVTTEVKKV